MISDDEMKNENEKIVDNQKPLAGQYASEAHASGTGRKQLLVSLVILLVGVVLTVMLVKFKKPPQMTESKKFAPLVKTQILKPRDVTMVISGFGTVSPKVQVEIVPQVSGKVVWVNPEFKAGGFIKKDKPIIEIDPRDYQLAVQQAQAVVAEAKVRLDLEKAEALVARKEWDQINPGKEPTSTLVLREPQIKRAQAQLASADAQLETAKLSLERTKITLPIEARIISETVDLGQYVSIGQSIGNAYGLEAVEIELPLEDHELKWFDVPENSNGFDANDPTAKTTVAYVKADFAGAQHTWKGYVTRTAAEIDKKSRLVSVIIEVTKPFDNIDNKPDLLPGMFVEIFIEGKVLKNVFAVPRNALHERDKLWIIENEKLRIIKLDIVRFDDDYAYTTSSLNGNVTIVVSSLDIAADGMKIRTKIEPKDSDTAGE
ncbi:MAG: efflux RND transporter periplasmic adaptor subunit [Planctomycetes bacterium]|nr:efflux RND transporter periplasmic adaptor subunit [Planctomycetota bacterium]